MIQEFALLGFDTFKSIIGFIKNILNVGWLNFKKYKNEFDKNEKITAKADKRGVQIRNRKKKKGTSKWSILRHIKDINKTMGHHAEELNIHSDTMKHRWVNYEYKKNPSFFDSNVKLAKHKQKEFDKLQQKLWKEYHNNPERIKNLTLNIVNRRQSYRDVSEKRVSVCLCIIYLYVCLSNICLQCFVTQIYRNVW